jgi:uncharacterized protein (DUF58 family)
VLVALAVTFTVASPPPAADAGVVAVVAAAGIGLLLVGALVPMVAVRRIGVEVRSPRDLTVGDTALLDVRTSGPVGSFELRALDPTGPWRRATAPGSGQIPHLADRRGLFSAVRVEVRVTAPLGLVAAHRVHTIELPMAVEVAPRPLGVTWAPAPAPVTGGPHPVAQPALAGDLVRSVRPYVVGDPAHLVHWPSSARTGTIVVRELEPPRPVGQAVVVDLRDAGDQTERAAAYGLGAARAVLAAGGELVLCTAEAGGPVTARVTNPLDAGRRLARAVPGVPGEPPPGWPVVEIGA